MEKIENMVNDFVIDLHSLADARGVSEYSDIVINLVENIVDKDFGRIAFNEKYQFLIYEVYAPLFHIMEDIIDSNQQVEANYIIDNTRILFAQIIDQLTEEEMFENIAIFEYLKNKFFYGVEVG